MSKYLYFVTRGDEPEQEVTQQEFVRAERAAGFHNTSGEPNEPATSAFSSQPRGCEAVSGRMEYVR